MGWLQTHLTVLLARNDIGGSLVKLLREVGRHSLRILIVVILDFFRYV
jgi:hypothetical protein